METLNQMNNENSEVLNQSFDITLNGPPSFLFHSEYEDMEQV